jgi:transposase
MLLLGDGRPVHEVSLERQVSKRSVYNWAHAWREKGLCGLLVGHKGGRPRALSDALIATAVEAACAEPMTLKQIAQRIELIHGEPLACRLKTLAVALKRAGLICKRARYSLPKTRGT